MAKKSKPRKAKKVRIDVSVKKFRSELYIDAIRKEGSQKKLAKKLGTTVYQLRKYRDFVLKGTSKNIQRSIGNKDKNSSVYKRDKKFQDFDKKFNKYVAKAKIEKTSKQVIYKGEKLNTHLIDANKIKIPKGTKLVFCAIGVRVVFDDGTQIRNYYGQTIKASNGKIKIAKQMTEFFNGLAGKPYVVLAELTSFAVTYL